MNMKNTTRVFLGLVAAAAFAFTACNSANNPKTPSVNDDELGIKTKFYSTLESFASTKSLNYDNKTQTFTTESDLDFSDLLGNEKLKDFTVDLSVSPKDGTVKINSTKKGFTVSENAKDTKNGDKFVVTAVFSSKDGKKKSTMKFHILNKKGVTAAPAPSTKDFKDDEVTAAKIKALIAAANTGLNLDELAADASVTLPTSVKIGAVDAVTAAWTVKTGNQAEITGSTLTVNKVAAGGAVELTVTLTKDGYNAKTVEVSLTRKTAAPAPSAKEFKAEEVTAAKIKALIAAANSGLSLDALEENASVTLPASVTIADVSDVAAAWTVKSPATAKIESGKLDVTAVPADTQVNLTVTLTKEGYNAKAVEVSLKRKAAGPAPSTKEFKAEEVTAAKIKALIAAANSGLSLDALEENASVTLPASVTIGDVDAVTAAWTVKSPATAKIESGKLDVTAVPADTQVNLTVTLTKEGYNAKTVEVSLKRKA